MFSHGFGFARFIYLRSIFSNQPPLCVAMAAQTTLSDLPNEIVIKVFAGAYSGLASEARAERISALRTRLAVECTSRRLRQLSFLAPWEFNNDYDPKRIGVDALLHLLVPDGEGTDRTGQGRSAAKHVCPHSIPREPALEGLRILIIDCPGRLAAFSELQITPDFALSEKDSHDLAQAFFATKEGRVNALRLIASMSMLPILRLDWVPRELELHFVENAAGYPSPDELVDVVSTLAPKLESFSLYFTVMTVKANGDSLVCRIVDAFKGQKLKNLGLFQKTSEDAEQDGCTIKSTVSMHEIALLGPQLESIVTGNIWLHAPQASFVPLPNLKRISIEYPSCFCDAEGTNVIFAGHGYLDEAVLEEDKGERFFPVLTDLEIHGPTALSFQQIAQVSRYPIFSFLFSPVLQHCPNLERLETVFWRDNLENELLAKADPADSILDELVSISKLERWIITARNYEGSGLPDFPEAQKMLEYVGFEKKALKMSGGKLAVFWDFDLGKALSIGSVLSAFGIPPDLWDPPLEDEAEEDDENGEESSDGSDAASESASSDEEGIEMAINDEEGGEIASAGEGDLANQVSLEDEDKTAVSSQEDLAKTDVSEALGMQLQAVKEDASFSATLSSFPAFFLAFFALIVAGYFYFI